MDIDIYTRMLETPPFHVTAASGLSLRMLGGAGGGYACLEPRKGLGWKGGKGVGLNGVGARGMRKGVGLRGLGIKAVLGTGLGGRW